MGVSFSHLPILKWSESKMGQLISKVSPPQITPTNNADKRVKKMSPPISLTEQQNENPETS